MYVYGLSIGMEFDDIADILMSPVGNVIKNMLDDDKFSGRDAFGTVSEGLFKYFIDGPFRQLLKFDISTDSTGNRLSKSPMEVLQINLADEANLKDKNGKPLNLTNMLVEISKKPWTLVEKIKILENIRNKYDGRIEGSVESSEEAVEVYNQLIDFVEDYIQQSDIIWKHEGTFQDIAKLSAGAQEMKTLGQVLSLNQGIKTTSSDFLTQINNLRRAIYNKTGDLEDIVDLTKFAFDENPYVVNGHEYSSYREYIIERYEGIKEAFNIFDVVTKVTHFMGYLQALVTTNVEVNNAFTFRSSDNLLLPVKEKLGKYIKEDKLTVGIQNYCSDWLLKHWMLDTGKQITIPAGNQAFDRNGNLYTLTEDTTIWLGTDWGNATFRLWMENEVIPNLKEGIIIPGKQYSKISNNKFIKDLGNNLLNKTISRNATVVQTLPINMLPSTDAERSTFNQYKSQFNELTDGYQYELNSYITDQNGNIIKQTTLSEPISITDLFIYYAMIANSWKLDQISLVPITEDFQNRGIIEEFHNYVADIDKSGFTLSLDNILWEELLPYVAPSDSPYSSSAEVIWYRNPKTQKRVLMDKLSKGELQQIRSGEVRPSNVFGKYQAREAIDNLNFFSTGQIGKNSKITLDIMWNDKQVKVPIIYSTDTNQVQKIDMSDSELGFIAATDSDIYERLSWIEEIPMIKQGTRMVPNIPLLKMLLNHALNPCS